MGDEWIALVDENAARLTQAMTDALKAEFRGNPLKRRYPDLCWLSTQLLTGRGQSLRITPFILMARMTLRSARIILTHSRYCTQMSAITHSKMAGGQRIMSETKPRKAEAMALLELDTRTPEQDRRLNKLTAQQAGYNVREVNGAPWNEPPLDRRYGLFLNDGFIDGTRAYDESSPWGDVPDYIDSVDACLKLPIKTGWALITPRPDDSMRYDQPAGGQDKYTALLYNTGEAVDGQSLPAAMLYIWWIAQPDE